MHYLPQQCPRVEAKKRLQVHRDPVVIQEEKATKKEQKEKRECIQQEEATRGKAATCFVKENHMQQKVAMAKEDVLMPCCRSQCM